MKKERKMKKVLFPILALVLALGLALPIAVVGASPDSMTVVSDTSVLITEVYNKAGGVNSFVDLSGSPLTAVRAQEPKPYPTGYLTEGAEVTDSVWDNGVNWFEDNASGADWIWETERAEGPASLDPGDARYDADAARYGRVVLFETTFNIPGVPTSATLHIAADNGYEAWVNTGTHYLSPTAVGGSGWENSNLWETNLSTSGWQSYGTHIISGSDLVSGVNTLYVLAGNEYFWTDDGNSPVPPTQSGPYKQYNPGAAIFQLDVEYEEPSIEVEKDYRHTNVAFERDNDLDGLFNEDPIDLIDNDGDGLIDEDPVDYPGGTYLGDLLPMDNGNYQLEAVINPKNDKVKSYNPGQYYAVSTVNVLADIGTLTIFEDWSDCDEISTLNPRNGGGRVVIVQVGPGDDVAYQILDANMVGVTFPTATSAKAVLQNVVAGTTILMYVKFGPGLKGDVWNPQNGYYGPCINYNSASTAESPTIPEDWEAAGDDWVVDSANLIVVAKE